MVSGKDLTDVKVKEVTWYWKPFIPQAQVTLVQGDTNVGKTNILTYIMALLSNGIYPPTMYNGRLEPMKKGKKVKIYYVTRENGIDDTYTPFFDLFGGDRSMVKYQDEDDAHFELTKEDIRTCVKEYGLKIIVVDPWQAFLEEGINASDNFRVRKMLDDMISVAKETGTAIILAGNYTKQSNGDILSGLGAAEMFNTLRAILTVKYHENPAIRTVEASKMSFMGKETAKVGVRQIDDYKLEFVDLAAEHERLEPQSMTEKAKRFLMEILADGPVDSHEVNRLADEAGISMPTINRAKKEIGVISRKQSDRSSLWMISEQ